MVHQHKIKDPHSHRSSTRKEYEYHAEVLHPQERLIQSILSF